MGSLMLPPYSAPPFFLPRKNVPLLLVFLELTLSFSLALFLYGSLIFARRPFTIRPGSVRVTFLSPSSPPIIFSFGIVLLYGRLFLV